MTNDEENTWRALQDQRPVITSRLCFFNWHKWTKWSEPFKYDYKYYQARECVHCNCKQNKRIDLINGVAYAKN